MEASQLKMTELLFIMVDQCPQAASNVGVTVMIGGQYEIACVLPKWINSFCLPVGTSDINFNAENYSSGIGSQHNISGGVYTDICRGVGPDVGTDLSLMGGIALTGANIDLEDCSFSF